MAQKIKQREYLFRTKPRRARPAFAVIMLGAASLMVAGINDGSADDRAAVNVPTGEEQSNHRVFGAVGGPERFVLEEDTDGASIQFLCRQVEMQCDEQSAVSLRAQTTDGERVFVDAVGLPVLTLAQNGGTLHAGSRIVPTSVPSKGRAVLPTTATKQIVDAARV